MEFPATAAGYVGLLSWLSRFGTVGLVGVEGTGSYGAGLVRHLAAAGVWVVEVDRGIGRTGTGRASPTRWMRSAHAGRPIWPGARAPKSRDGAVEAIRALMVAKRSARAERTRLCTGRPARLPHAAGSPQSPRWAGDMFVSETSPVGSA